MKFYAVKNYLLIFLSFFFLQIDFSYGQKDSTSEKERRIFFKLFYSPSFSFKKAPSQTSELFLTNTFGESGETLAYESKNEIGNYSFQTGFFTEIKLFKKTFISLGFAIARMKYQTKKNTLFYIEQYSQWPPYVTYDTTTDRRLNKSYDFISIPLTFNYTFKKEKLIYSAGIGISYDLLYKFGTKETPGKQYGQQQTTYQYNYFPDRNSPPIYYWSFIIDASISYQINKWLVVGAEPHFKFYFYNSYNKINLANKEEITGTGFDSQLKLFSLGVNVFLKV